MAIEELVRAIVREELENMAKESTQDTLEVAEVIESDEVIDRLLLDGKREQRTYRGFYWDKDIIGFLDDVKHGNKSDLMNEIVRAVLKDKGLIK